MKQYRTQYFVNRFR